MRLVNPINLKKEVNLLTPSYLEYLSLAFNSLTGTLPSELGKLNRLQFLNMRSSKVQGTIPNELGNLKNLGKTMKEEDKDSLIRKFIN